jgi:hypothetical protein
MADADVEGGVRSVQIALDVLEAAAFSKEELGVTQIADRQRLTKGSVHRHLLTLVDRRYLNQNTSTSRSSVGPKSRLLARFAPDTDLVQLSEAPMGELRDQLGQTRACAAGSRPLAFSQTGLCPLPPKKRCSASTPSPLLVRYNFYHGRPTRNSSGRCVTAQSKFLGASATDEKLEHFKALP